MRHMKWLESFSFRNVHSESMNYTKIKEELEMLIHKERIHEGKFTKMIFKVEEVKRKIEVVD